MMIDAIYKYCCQTGYREKVNKLIRVFQTHAADAQAGEKCFARDM